MNSLSSHENEINVAPLSCMEILSSLKYINMIFLCECFIVLLPDALHCYAKKNKKES